MWNLALLWKMFPQTLPSINNHRRQLPIIPGNVVVRSHFGSNDEPPFWLVCWCQDALPDCEPPRRYSLQLPFVPELQVRSCCELLGRRRKHYQWPHQVRVGYGTRHFETVDLCRPLDSPCRPIEARRTKIGMICFPLAGFLQECKAYSRASTVPLDFRFSASSTR